MVLTGGGGTAPGDRAEFDAASNDAGNESDNGYGSDGEDEAGEALATYHKGPGLDSTMGQWAQLVIRCARALKRSTKNLPVSAVQPCNLVLPRWARVTCLTSAAAVRRSTAAKARSDCSCQSWAALT